MFILKKLNSEAKILSHQFFFVCFVFVVDFYFQPE